MNATPNLVLANCFVYVDDPDAALAFYRDVLGLAVRTDVTNGDFSWLTVSPPSQPELEITLQQPQGMPAPEEDKRAIAELTAKGVLGALIFQVDDVDAEFARIKAAGAEVMQEPADQFYGVRDCAFRDPAGNMIRINQPLAQGGEAPQA